jgi:hypothetical protein
MKPDCLVTAFVEDWSWFAVATIPWTMQVKESTW